MLDSLTCKTLILLRFSSVRNGLKNLILQCDENTSPCFKRKTASIINVLEKSVCILKQEIIRQIVALELGKSSFEKIFETS